MACRVTMELGRDKGPMFCNGKTWGMNMQSRIGNATRLVSVVRAHLRWQSERLFQGRPGTIPKWQTRGARRSGAGLTQADSRTRICQCKSMSDRHAAHMVWPGLRTARLPTLAKHYELMHSSRPNHRATRMSNDYSWLMRKAVFACKEIMCPRATRRARAARVSRDDDERLRERRGRGRGDDDDQRGADGRRRRNPPTHRDERVEHLAYLPTLLTS